MHLLLAALIGFYGPDNMAFDASGNVYVVDTDGKSRARVLELSPGGTVLAQWRGFLPVVVPGAAFGPEGIAFGSDGSLLVTDAGAGRILMLSPALAPIGTFARDRNFPNLGHIAVDAHGKVYVAQAGPNLIDVYSPLGDVVTFWQRPKGAGVDAWGGPQSIAVFPDGNVAVEDWRNRRVEILSPDGKTLTTIGRKGSGPGEFLNTAGLAVDGRGFLYVADRGLHRIAKFDENGRLVATVGNTAAHALFQHGGPSAVAIDAAGNLYSPDGLTIVKYSQTGLPLARWQ